MEMWRKKEKIRSRQQPADFTLGHTRKGGKKKNTSKETVSLSEIKEKTQFKNYNSKIIVIKG